MKHTLYLFCLVTLTLIACGGSEKSGTKFTAENPKATLSLSEREVAIEQKHNELDQKNRDDSILLNHDVSFSVLPPVVSQNLPETACEKLATRMIHIASQNGIGGLCLNPVLAMVSQVNCINHSLTGPAPQKAIVKYEVTMYCGNFISNDIYASSMQTITGVGSTFTDAANKAINELKNTTEMQQMLQTASQRAIAWYNSPINVKRLVDKAVSERNYALAMALLSSVPEQARETYKYAEKRNKEVSDMFFEEKATELLGEFEGAIAAAGENFCPELGAYLKVIPVRSSSYPRAKQIYDKYLKHVGKVKKEERDFKFQIEKIKAPYEAEAVIARINADARIGVAQANAERAKNANTGGFLGLGKLWDNTHSIITKVLDKAFYE